MPKASKAVTDFKDLDSVASHQVDLKEVPERFNGTIIDSSIDKDKQGQSCLYLTIAIDGTRGDNEQLVRQKFTGTTVGPLRDSLKDLGFMEIPINEPMLSWTKGKVGRATYERWLPSAKA